MKEQSLETEIKEISDKVGADIFTDQLNDELEKPI